MVDDFNMFHKWNCHFTHRNHGCLAAVMNGGILNFMPFEMDVTCEGETGTVAELSILVIASGFIT